MADTKDFVKATLDGFPMPSRSEQPSARGAEPRQDRQQSGGPQCGETFTTQGVGRVAVDDCDDISQEAWDSCANEAAAAAFKQAQAVCDGLRGCQTLYYRPSSVEWWVSCENGRLIMSVTFEVQCR